MNGIDYLADTNVILYFLSGNECMKNYMTSRFAFSVISEIELLSYTNITKDEEKRVRGFLACSELIPISRAIKEQAIKIRKKYKVKLPDAIIAASSIVSDIGLITADEDFKKIKELKLTLITPNKTDE